jgi:hypothetical protein
MKLVNTVANSLLFRCPKKEKGLGHGGQGKSRSNPNPQLGYYLSRKSERLSSTIGY